MYSSVILAGLGSYTQSVIEALEYIANHWGVFLTLLQTHMTIVLVGVGAAIVVAVPLGIVVTRHDKLGWMVMNMGAIAQTLPPLAVIAISFSFLGLGRNPVILALFFYALLPILKNTVAGLRSVDDSKVEAGRGMGMTQFERLTRIELPLAMPVIFAGIRTSTVMSVGVAYLGAFIGAGGFGNWVVLGQQQLDTHITMAGAIPGAALVIVLDQLFKRLQGVVTPATSTTKENTEISAA
ncbi:osmoprotectant transport system permease protein [Halogranum rubrum]|uniref:Osmoprotectant transport system permease protein n=2 Tax=Halogranum rubrum TaxID=553466 RepID=A0A1I4HXF1_9EURY|nr:osmoprotectant transport system permease protein [Halogranum rubrum]